MPVYSYQCTACQAAFAISRRMSDGDAETRCPDCGSLQTQRLISTVAVFSGGANGERRALAGMSSCSGCSASGHGCSGCRSR